MGQLTRANVRFVVASAPPVVEVTSTVLFVTCARGKIDTCSLPVLQLATETYSRKRCCPSVFKYTAPEASGMVSVNATERVTGGFVTVWQLPPDENWEVTV